MAWTVTTTLNKIFRPGRELWQIICDFTSDTTASLSHALASTLYAAGKIPVSSLCGELLQVEVSPGLLGDCTTAQPTIAYAVTVTDDYSLDVTEAALSACTANSATALWLSPPPLLNGEVTLNVASVGITGKSGRVILTMEM